MATRPEITGKRDLTFSQWIRENLPDSKTGFMVSDVDFIMFNYKKKTMAIVEVKTRSCKLKTWQRIFLINISRWIQNGIDDDWIFKGLIVITFENTWFDDGKCFVEIPLKKEGVWYEVTEQKLIEMLSF